MQPVANWGGAHTQLCLAVSDSADATGAWHRYDFTLGSEDYALPKLGVWPDAYYVATMVFDASLGNLLGPQPFALDRAAMLAGLPATLVSPGRLSADLGYLLPADLDGSLPPPPGGQHPWIETDGSSWSIFRFDPDFSTPGQSTWTLAGALTPAAFTALTASVPQKDTGWTLPSLGDQPMYRLAYRRFPDGHDALVGNLTVSSGSVAAIRWWEIHDAISGTPGFAQEGTYRPDSTWRWLGSAALDHAGDLAIGFSASSSSIYPQIRYAGRLAGDPAGTLGQGEEMLHAGTGSQINTGSYNVWGSHSHLAVDPVDDCTFWYTNEYYATTSAFNWRTRIGSFKFPDCAIVPTFALDVLPERRGVCAPANATWSVSLTSVGGFSGSTTLSVTGQPFNASAQFSPNPVSPPGTSTLTVGNTGAAAPGTYVLDVQGTASGFADRHQTVTLDLYGGVPGAPSLIAPANGAIAQLASPTFAWTAAAQLPATYALEIATDAGFTAIVHSAAGLTSASYSGAALETSTVYYWRVRTANACGAGSNSAVYSFTTLAGPGDCPLGTIPATTYTEGFEGGAGGWTHSGTGDTWALSAANPRGGAQSFFASNPASVSDQRLVSPSLAIPPATLALFRFWNWQHMETKTGGCYDGGVLEISTDGGTGWTQVGGASLLTDPYDGPIHTGASNPLAGLQAWCGNNPQPYLDSVVDVTPWAGQTAQFRFRLGSDNSVAKPGWYIDDVRLQTCTDTRIFADGFEDGTLDSWSSHTH